MIPDGMCGSCIHKGRCPAAFKKDHWFGNHTSGRMGGIPWTMKRSVAAPAAITGKPVENGIVSMSNPRITH